VEVLRLPLALYASSDISIISGEHIADQLELNKSLMTSVFWGFRENKKKFVVAHRRIELLFRG
jgi:hypothetical protein